MVSVFHQLVDVVLGAVLARRHFEHVRDAQQGFPGVAVGDDLAKKEMEFNEEIYNITNE